MATRTRFTTPWPTTMEQAEARIIQLEKENATLEGANAVLRMDNNRLKALLARASALLRRQVAPTLSLVMKEIQDELSIN